MYHDISKRCISNRNGLSLDADSGLPDDVLSGIFERAFEIDQNGPQPINIARVSNRFCGLVLGLPNLWLFQRPTVLDQYTTGTQPVGRLESMHMESQGKHYRRRITIWNHAPKPATHCSHGRSAAVVYTILLPKLFSDSHFSRAADDVYETHAAHFLERTISNSPRIREPFLLFKFSTPKPSSMQHNTIRRLSDPLSLPVLESLSVFRTVPILCLPSYILADDGPEGDSVYNSWNLPSLKYLRAHKCKHWTCRFHMSRQRFDTSVHFVDSFTNVKLST